MVREWMLQLEMVVRAMSRMNTRDRRPASKARPDGPPADDDAARLVAAALAEQAAREMAEPLAGGLYVVATPIGNLGDMTVRAATTLARADAILCEDTRVSRTLLARYAIKRPLRAFHEHNEEAEQVRVLAELADGHAIALISDAGTPLLSDPGFKLVRAVVAAGHPVVALPGASAVLAGLTMSGLPTDSFFFGGFLPARQAARRSRLEQLATVPASLVLFESPGRLAEALGDIAATLGAREVVVARELTKHFEEVRRGARGRPVARDRGRRRQGRDRARRSRRRRRARPATTTSSRRCAARWQRRACAMPPASSPTTSVRRARASTRSGSASRMRRRECRQPHGSPKRASPPPRARPLG